VRCWHGLLACLQIISARVLLTSLWCACRVRFLLCGSSFPGLFVYLFIWCDCVPMPLVLCLGYLFAVVSWRMQLVSLCLLSNSYLHLPLCGCCKSTMHPKQNTQPPWMHFNIGRVLCPSCLSDGMHVRSNTTHVAS